MNQRQIECFLTIARNHSFSKAAEILFLSQPAVSKQISSLETELGVSLFYRMKHKQTELTPVGKLYFDYFSKTTDEFRAVQKQAHLLGQQITGSLKFGVLAGWNVSAFLQPFLQYFQKEYPNIEVQLSFLDPEVLRKSADHFHLDVIVTLEDSLLNDSVLETLPFQKIQRMLFYSMNHPVAKEKLTPTITDFRESTFLSISDQTFDSDQLVSDYLKPYHFHPQIQLVPSLEHAIAASHNGMGVMIIDEWSREMNNTAFQHIPMNSYNQAVLAWHPENTNPVISYFINKFADYMQIK